GERGMKIRPYVILPSLLFSRRESPLYTLRIHLMKEGAAEPTRTRLAREHRWCHRSYPSGGSAVAAIAGMDLEMWRTSRMAQERTLNACAVCVRPSARSAHTPA